VWVGGGGGGGGAAEMKKASYHLRNLYLIKIILYKLEKEELLGWKGTEERCKNSDKEIRRDVVLQEGS